MGHDPRRLAVWAIIALVMLVSPALPSSLSEEWRFPDESDIIGDWKIYQKEGHVFNHFSADFNGDNRNDEAWILIAKDNSAWGVFVFMNVDGADKRIIEILRSGMDVPPQNMGISPASPEHYIAACAKGFGSPCKPGEKRFLDLKHTGIDFFRFESGASILYWEEVSNKFESFWYSD